VDRGITIEQRPEAIVIPIGDLDRRRTSKSACTATVTGSISSIEGLVARVHRRI
jgi:hypothetical protein